ncbi:hypothetical protein [Bradyrhizobium sp. 33ap4]|uniref:hypothetical protein n=1 Tax=Bradyrhizobium sp. 33ap4 TaxID=3061630 RepID=UPI00292E54DF|nr:hypothetical protein [Bradyrhizobium sp. 33ap4]
MRQVQFEGRVIQVPDDATDAEVSQILSTQPAAPASNLSDVAASTAPAVASQPAVAAAAADADTAALTKVSQPKGWYDTLHDAVFGPPAAPAPEAPSRGVMGTLSDIGDQGAYLARGARRGVANIVGLPVDLVNAGMAVAGAPVSPKPFMGSKSIDEALGGFGLIPEVRPPSTMTERLLSRTGEEIGAAAVPVGAAVQAGKMGVEAARELPVLARMFVEPAAINPVRFAVREGSTAAAAGTGAGLAGEAARGMGAQEHGTAANTLDILGALGGAGALGAARIVERPLNDVRQALFNRDKFSNQLVKENVTDRLLNNAETLPKVEGQPIDSQPLVDAINRGPRVSETIPGFKESIADRTADPGLATLEYGRQTGTNAREFAARRTENTAAVDAEMQRNAPNGNPADLRAELDLERGRRLTDAGVQTQNAQDAFERATQSLRPVMTGEGRGANIRQALEGASADARAIVGEAWAPLNRSGEQVDMAPLARDFARVNRGLSTAERERFQPNEAGIPQRLSGERPVEPPQVDAAGNPVTEPITQPLREVTGLRSALTDASREARTAGRTNEARIIDEHVTALDNYLDQNVPETLRQQYDAARDATVDYHDRFTRPQSAIAQTLDRTEGQYRQPDSAIAGKFVQADEGRINEFRNLMRETGNDDRTISAVRDQILADVRDRGLLERPDQLREYLGRYNTVLSDPRFAGVRGQLDNAAGLRRSLDEATASQANLTRELGAPDRPGTSTVGKYLAYGDERSQDALKGIIASKNPGAAIDEALNFVNNDARAVEGAKKSFWDLMQSKSRSNGETTRTTDGTQPWMPNRLKNFLDDPANAAVAERLYRDDPEQLARVRKIADELQNVDLRSRGKAPNTSGTSQGLSNVLTPETLQSRLYAYKRGQTSLGFMLTALGSVAARRLVRGAQGDAIERLLDKALLDPDLAAQLLKENNPANRAALARTTKAYLGNEASTLTDILTGQPAPDDVKDAINRDDKNGR